MINIEDMVGSRILGIKLNGLKDYLRVETDKGPFNFVAVGGCCSTSWIEHLNGVKNVIEGVITEAPVIGHTDHIKEDGNREDDFNVTLHYITQLKTDKGTLDIEFRNNSNGYYSGWLTLDEDQDGDPVEVPDDLKDITKDF